MIRFVHRAAAAIILATLVSTLTVAPVLAECFPRPPVGWPIVRPYVFTATVRDVVTEVDQQSIDAGEGPGVLWRTTLDVSRVYRGAVPDVLNLDGATSDDGVGGGCSYFLGDRLTPGETLLVAIDEQIDFATNSALYGNLFLWRAVGDGWEFYAEALQDGGDPLAYLREAREAHTTSQVLAAIAADTPDTATAPVVASQDRPEDDWTRTFAMIGMALLVASVVYSRGPWRTSPKR